MLLSPSVVSSKYFGVGISLCSLQSVCINFKTLVIYSNVVGSSRGTRLSCTCAAALAVQGCGGERSLRCKEGVLLGN